MRIVSIKGREILDSRGNPTIEADVVLEDGVMVIVTSLISVSAAVLFVIIIN